MKNNQIIILFGFSLFFLVMVVLYSVIFLAPKNLKEGMQIFAPLVVFSGFFIFLIGAMLVALSLYKILQFKNVETII
jgi:hypothetical protein